MDDVRLSGDEASLASEIQAIDRQLDALEARTQHLNVTGMHSFGLGGAHIKQAEDLFDDKRADLLATRAALVARLQQLVDGK